jgi:uncharacterized protein YjaG (DUF416 family)
VDALLEGLEVRYSCVSFETKLRKLDELQLVVLVPQKIDFALQSVNAAVESVNAAVEKTLFLSKPLDLDCAGT